MSVATALAVGGGGSGLSFALAYLAWGPWGYRNMPEWADWSVLLAVLVVNVAGWIVALLTVS